MFEFAVIGCEMKELSFFSLFNSLAISALRNNNNNSANKQEKSLPKGFIP